VAKGGDVISEELIYIQTVKCKEKDGRNPVETVLLLLWAWTMRIHFKSWMLIADTVNEGTT
jgi:hypothetical protein